jgi:dolichol-phosphate mannosyltransferase
MKILVAVPVFNEAKYVAAVLREIRKYARAARTLTGDDIRVLVVDDGSTDATPVVLKSLKDLNHIDLITHPVNRGYGQSLIDAFAFASDHSYDWVITMDCDEQHEPCRIPLFIKECLKDDADIVSGSRYMLSTRDADQPPEDRRAINAQITRLINSTLNLALTDSFCGFKAHRVGAMDKLTLTIPGYAFPMQFWVQAAANNLRIREIPVKLIYKDATRHFGGLLDDPAARLRHYLDVFQTEMALVVQAS